MKILVPMDFSDCSYDALAVALDLAKDAKDEVTLLHAIENYRFIGHLDHKQINILIQLSTEKLEKVIQEQSGVSAKLKTRAVEGSLAEVITSENNSNNYDLVVMGSHGVSGKKEWFIGSNTQKVIRSIQTNTLIVKDNVSVNEFKEVVFVTGLNAEDQDAFRYFLQFVKPFNLKKIHILNIDTMFYLAPPEMLQSHAVNDFRKIAKEYECEVVFYKDYSVDAGVRHFTKEKKIDLVAISNHVRHPIKRIFQGSNVEIIVNHSTVPVLSIDYKN